MRLTPVMLETELGEASARMHRLVEPLTISELNRRPAPDRWSVGECLLHLIETNRAYLDPLRRAAAVANSEPQPYYSLGWFASFFVSAQEPPPRIKLPAPRRFRPTSREVAADVTEEFDRVQSEVLALLRDSAGLDLRQRTKSPASRLLRLPMIAIFGTIAAHERRHLWQAEQVVASGFSPVGTGPDSHPKR